MEESIYNIIPKEYNPPAKEPLYKSKFPPNVKPTGSTFGNHTTSKPLVPIQLSRPATSEGKSESDSRPTQNTPTPRPLAMSRGTASPSPADISKRIRGRWATRPSHQVRPCSCSPQLLLRLHSQEGLSAQGG